MTISTVVSYRGLDMALRKRKPRQLKGWTSINTPNFPVHLLEQTKLYKHKTCVKLYLQFPTKIVELSASTADYTPETFTQKVLAHPKFRNIQVVTQDFSHPHFSVFTLC